MPSIVEVRRMRKRHRDKQRRLQNLGRASVIALAALITILVLVGLGVSIGYAELQRGLPAIEELPTIFETAANTSPAPTQFYDRTGEVVFQAWIHPLAADRLWLSVDAATSSGVPEFVVSATIAAQDPGFWTNPGFEFNDLLQVLKGEDVEGGFDNRRGTISQQLVQSVLQPIEDTSLSPMARYLRSAILASRLNDAFSKEQILEWYLNSANYGNLAYGIDAAARVYFGVTAAELSVAQAAMLAPVVQAPELNPMDAYQEARQRQIEVLQEMLRLGYLDEGEVNAAMDQPINLRDPAEVRNGLRTSGFMVYAWEQMLAIMGPQFVHRPGMQVRTTLDLDLQLQADCALRTHLARLKGDSSPQVQPASDGSECEAGLELPPLRPSDVGLDHHVSDIASIILDPFRGEILSMVDTQARLSSHSATLLGSNVERDLGSAFYPFIFLSAFSRGFAPGTMVMDLPLELDDGVGETAAQYSYDWTDFHGPARMRTALVGAYRAAALRTIELAGEGNVLRTGQQMGIINMNAPETYDPNALLQGETEASLMDVIYAYAVIANNGSMIGVDLSNSDADAVSQTRNPIAITLIEDASGKVIYAANPEVRAVLSPQLAYLMADVLSDEVARWDTLGQSNPLEIGRPAGAMIGTTSTASDNWALGFTPTRAVGVWIGNTTDENMVGVGALNGAAPLWHALMVHATMDLPTQGWSMPPGVSEMEVCDPSGLLPTSYCPNVVREVYIHGTEPTSYDTLYQPFRINRDTGKLATLFTPLELVEERVFMVLPQEAKAWAEYMGIAQPPQEYDSIYVQPSFDPDVNITSLEPFSYAKGVLSIEGNAHPEDFLYYRLKYGEGINPTRWVQIGEDLDEPVWDGVLGLWDTSDLNGLHTLQLVVIREGDRVESTAVPVTLDNLAPEIEWIAPQQGQQYRLGLDDEVIIQVVVADDTGLARVMIYVDERRIKTLENPPFTTSWRIAGMGEHEISVRAYDLAGNLTQINGLTIEVIP
ncbi:MAG TPA: hypothetical protein G4O08_10100 [Anaerolineae bacterium]|nr:hypothetical protein [Anaerolineae bacterium]